ncbi:MAG: amidohydrolase/deacetylase family metallohydrolase [Halieaceae bacterium]|jgi:dihydroorotase|nr:amidohydrolase/deacetylase family metallohydrolase [Halieaceae bacterium]
MSTSVTLIQNALVIDPANQRNEITDVAIQDDKVLEIGHNLRQAHPQADVIDASGKIICPGLIDLHVHVMTGFGDFCLPPDFVGVDSGVTTVVDAGTSSTSLFGMARKGVIDQPDVKTRVLAFMDPCKIYIATSDFICHKLRIADNENNLDIEVTRQVVEENRDVIVGFKVRAAYSEQSGPEVSPFLNAALSVSDDLPVMVHFGGFPHTPVIPALTLMNKLRPGDIVTHAFRAGSGILDQHNQPLPDYIAAYERGVVMDIGHSSGDFHIGTARHLIQLGYKPTTISTDLNAFNYDGPVYTLTETMSKLWNLGLELDEVIAMVTSHPARTLHRSDTLGALAPGREADITMLSVEEGEFEFSDGFETMTAPKRLVAEGCWRAGEWHTAKHRGAPRVSEPFAFRKAG